MRSEAAYFAVLPGSHPNIEVLVAVCERDAWRNILRWVKDEYPKAVPVLLSQRELLGAVAELRNRLRHQYELRLRELSARERVGGDGTSRIRSVREWTDEQFDDALSTVEDRNQILTSVSFDFYRIAGATADIVSAVRCRVSKSSEIEMSGRLDIIWSTVIEHISAIGSKKLNSFSRRGLRETNFRGAPLVIRYSEDVFSKLTEVRRLVEVLGHYPRAAHSVQHGNPYAFVQIADSFDGSTFDVWALSTRRVTIVPKLRATEAAVSRLVNYIFENFREGSVEADAAE